MTPVSTGDDDLGEPVLLLVEDNPDDVLLVRRALRKLAAPLRLVVVDHGDAAVDYLAGEAPFVDRSAHPLPQVMLLDLKLPRRSGHEVLQWLRSHARFDALPVIVLTTSSEDEDVRLAYANRANSYLRKPVSFEALVALLGLFHRYWLEANTIPTTGEAGSRED